MNDNIFKEACLVQLSTPCWQGSRMIDSSVMEQIGDSEWLRGRKYLVDPETLNPVRAVAGRARLDLSKLALPFPINGLTLVPKECLSRVEDKLLEHQSQFWREVDVFVTQYEEATQIAKRRLGNLFCEEDYPVEIHKKFNFVWRYFTISTPGKYNLLSPEVYQREKAKFEAMMEETRELAMRALRQEFAGNVNHIVERLTKSEDGRPKIFKNSMVERIQEYLDSFGSRNLFDDEDLARLVSTAKEIVGNVRPNWLRENTQLQHHIREKMSAVAAEIDKALVDMPRRKIRFAA